MRISITNLTTRGVGRLPALVLLAAFLASAPVIASEPVLISPEGVRATAVDVAYDSQGTAWLLWVQKGARIPGAGHASADDLYLTRWPSDGPPEPPIRVNSDPGSVRASVLSRARIAVDSDDRVHALYPVAGTSPVHGKPVINIRYQRLHPPLATVATQLNTPAENDLSSTSHSNVGSAATFLSLSAAPSGHLYALWIDSRHSEFTESNSWVYGARSGDGGDTWSADTPMYESVCPCCQPDSAWAGDHLLVSSRLVDEASHRDPHLMRFDAALAQQGAPARVGEARWQIEGCPLKRISVAGSSAREFVAWYAETENPKGVWLARRDTNQAAFSDYQALHPEALVSDAPASAAGGNTLWVAWHAKTENAERGIYLVTSTDAGNTLSAPERISGPEAAAYPALTLNANEGIISWEAGGRIVALRRPLADTLAHHANHP